MAEKHLVLCGGARLTARTKAWREAPKVRLQLGNGKKHLHLKIHHITRKIGGGLPRKRSTLSKSQPTSTPPTS